MNYRITATLLVILVALAGYAYYTESASPKQADSTGPQEPQIFSFDSASIEQLEIAQGDKQVVVVKGPEGNWEIKKPALGPADGNAVASMSARLAGLKANRLLTDMPGDLAQYGLDNPRFQITMMLQGGGTAGLLFGNKNPGDISHYVKLPDNSAVYLVYSSLGEDLQKWLTAPPIQTPTSTPFPTGTPNPEATRTP